MTLYRGRKPFAELVFHVLAHVRAHAELPSGLYDAEYAAWAARESGPASGRSLGEDAEALGRLLSSHSDLARAQLLAWLFGDLERAMAVAAKPLEALEPADVDAPELLASLAAVHAGVELLRCAVALERDTFVSLPPAMSCFEDVERELSLLPDVAPALARSRVLCVRSLVRRGRIRGDEIWVGVPDPALGVDARHVAFQAAHEATVGEVHRALGEIAEREIEHVALVLMAERARRFELVAEHATWLAHFGASLPPVTRDALRPGAAVWIERALASHVGARSST